MCCYILTILLRYRGQVDTYGYLIQLLVISLSTGHGKQVKVIKPRGYKEATWLQIGGIDQTQLSHTSQSRWPGFDLLLIGIP